MCVVCAEKFKRPQSGRHLQRSGNRSRSLNRPEQIIVGMVQESTISRPGLVGLAFWLVWAFAHLLFLRILSKPALDGSKTACRRRNTPRIFGGGLFVRVYGWPKTHFPRIKLPASGQPWRQPGPLVHSPSTRRRRIADLKNNIHPIAVSPAAVMECVC
jgi:hypothetical protein